ncbi:hypothetical protein C4D60_Mb06t25670 [Musa balbisiana]|uniref:Uncharacterized protein n=1 Tax=Musa balbisiana TaxID=52838 RepID=A0A4S8IQM8_MUSBA|nr:hypothetical protein C4D60_Mb06t25670 [Musa balbisiana]
MHIFESTNITPDSFKISALGDHSNTDGVANSIISIIDDCISINPNYINLTIFNVLYSINHNINIDNFDKNINEKNVITLIDPSLVKIKGIKFRNNKGTSTSSEAIKLVCIKVVPCESVKLNDTSLEYNDDDKQAKTMISTYVHVYNNSNGNMKHLICNC